MQIEIHSSFVRDAKKLPSKVKDEIANAVALILDAKTIKDIPT